MVVAPGRMIDSFLSIPDAESLPLYRMVLKLACVCVCVCVCKRCFAGESLKLTHTQFLLTQKLLRKNKNTTGLGSWRLRTMDSICCKTYASRM